ncbi:hypothetical protein I4F81_010808 [Pyropia yezoensis]|uniref:Uncharacterized protein n=1 Tax=Pyropia yezoensis TaxID=2788 RepID=A0ACC3CDS2_PYRYE|nr:hypothetical protein I4F81_010808 [Neopyropia yezoensis]
MHTLRLLTVTWNVGNAPPPSSLVALLGPPEALAATDLVAVALQEMPTRFDKVEDRVARMTLGPTFVLCGERRLFGIKLFVYHQRRLTHLIASVETVREGTGIANSVGNKGAVGVVLRLGDTSVAFINAHLAAHDGPKYRRERQEDVMDLVRSLERGRADAKRGDGGLPLFHRFTHLFWMGDLNYRLNTALTLCGQELPFEARRRHLLKLVTAGDVPALLAADELRHERARGSVFANFSEGPIHHLPSFKVRTGAAGVVNPADPAAIYADSRAPAYCDRILWHSLPLHRPHVRQLSYTWVPAYTVSDHKPVVASFALDIAKRVPRVLPDEGLRLTLDVQLIRLRGLYPTPPAPTILPTLLPPSAEVAASAKGGPALLRFAGEDSDEVSVGDMLARGGEAALSDIASRRRPVIGVQPGVVKFELPLTKYGTAGAVMEGKVALVEGADGWGGAWTDSAGAVVKGANGRSVPGGVSAGA